MRSEKRTNGRMFSQSLSRTWLRGAARLQPSLAVRWSADRFMTPQSSRPRSRHRLQLEAWKPHRLGRDSEAIACWHKGTGPTVVLCHGWGGHAGDLLPLAELLVNRGFRALVFDAPAHGLSAGTLSSLPHFAAAITAVADDFGPLDALVGHSMGGAAAALAMLQGLSVRRAAWIASPSQPEAWLTRFTSFVGFPDELGPALRAEIESRVGFAFRDLDLLERAREIATPILLVHDKGDREVPIASSQRLAEALVDATLLVTDGLGHKRILRAPAVLQEIADTLSNGAELSPPSARALRDQAFARHVELMALSL